MTKRFLSFSLMMLGIFLMVMPGKAQSQKSTQTTSTVGKSTVNNPVTDTGNDERPHFFYDSKGRPDPMDIPWYHKEFVETSTPKNEVPQKVEINIGERLRGRLTGVVYVEAKPQESLALIGTQIVKIGDTVTIEQLPKSAKVSKINKGEVVLVYEGKTYSVKISDS